jgi:hypothetical protein
VGLLDRAIDGAVRIGQGIAARVMQAPAMQKRQAELASLERLYLGTQYEGRGLGVPWDKVGAQAAKTPLRLQRPSVQYDLARIIVDRPTGLLFGEGRAPAITFDAHTVEGEDSETTEGTTTAINKWFADIAEEGGLASELLNWFRQGGSQGTAVLSWSVVDGEFEFQSHKAQYCAPTFHPRKRHRLIKLEKRYKFTRSVQSLENQIVVTKEATFWHREVWDETTHTVYVDVLVPPDGTEPAWTELSVCVHNFGFVPACWVKNLDDGEPSNADGVSLNYGLPDLFEDIDRTLSQKSRAVRYNQDPETVYFGLDEEQAKRLRVGGGASTLMPSKSEGAAIEKLELNGAGQTVAEEHVVAQRGRALETSRVTVPDPERLLAAAQSGSAIRLLFAPTLELVGELRQNYGRGLKEIFSQILQTVREGTLAALGALVTPPPATIPAGKVKLIWGQFFDPTPADVVAVSSAAVAMHNAGLMDQETLVRWLCSFVGAKDVAGILDRLETEGAAKQSAVLDQVNAVAKHMTTKPPQGGPPTDPNDDQADLTDKPEPTPAPGASEGSPP